MPKLPPHVRFTDHFLQTLKLHNKRNLRYVPIGQHNAQFRLLISDLNGKRSRILLALKDFRRNFGKEYYPVALTAKSFREKFDQIEAANRRIHDEGMKPVKAAMKVRPPTKLERSIADDLTLNLSWPKGSSHQVLPMVRSSLHFYKKWLSMVLKVRLRWICRSKSKWVSPTMMVAGRDKYVPSVGLNYSQMIALVDATVERNASEFVRNWMRKINRQVSGWDDWSGDLAPYTFSQTHKLYQQTMCESAAAYCGDSSAWIRLADHILQHFQ